MPASPPLPPNSARLLSDMGMRPGRTSGQPTYHAGMDLGHTGGRGTPVYAVQGGTVERVLRNDDATRAFSGYGNGVIVSHGDGTWALYAHLNRALAATGQVVTPGEQIGEMGNSSNNKFPGMGVHLHLELRHAKPNGSSPFPGPYRTYNLDPRPWLEAKGLHFGPRGQFQIQPSTLMAKTSSVWGGIAGMAGIDPYPRQHIRAGRRGGPGWMIPETALAGPDDNIVNTYDPPKRFDRDVMFGLTPTEWAAAGVGALLLTAGTVAFVVHRHRS